MDQFFAGLENLDVNLLNNVISQVLDPCSKDIDYNVNSMNGDEVNFYGCKHYFSRCKIISPCCFEEFNCRLCHDEKYWDNNNSKTRHKINRYKINKIICSECNVLQDISQFCVNCKICFSLYFCSKCNLFDDIDKGQFHCDKCKICRTGFKENYIHCDNCKICINKNVEEHKCFEVVETQCPVCMSDIFNSIEPVIQMKCCHYIHMNCFYELMDNTYKCPVCSTSVIEMDSYNKFMDEEIESTPMPEDYNIDIKILCNDCHESSEVKFHIIGLKCTKCGSYNTRKI